MVGEPAKFILRTSGPDLLFLELQITRIVKKGNETLIQLTEPIPVEYECLGENLHSVCYYPKEEGEYQVAVTWKGTHVSGSPFVAKVVKREAVKVSVELELKENKEEVWQLRDDVKSSRRQRGNRVWPRMRVWFSIVSVRNCLREGTQWTHVGLFKLYFIAITTKKRCYRRWNSCFRWPIGRNVDELC